MTLDGLLRALEEGRRQRPLPAPWQAAGLYLFTIAYAVVWWRAGPRLLPRYFFDEGGPVDCLSSIYLATAAILAWSLWRRARRGTEPDARFWLVSSICLAFLGLDERFQIHERMSGHGDGLMDKGPLRGVTVPLLEMRNDYMDAMQWDAETGKVKASRAKELGIDEVLEGHLA